MANDVSKTISLQELYAMMQPYKKPLSLCSPWDESTGLCATIPVKAISLFNNGTKVHCLLCSGGSGFVLQAASVKVSAPAFSRDSCSFTLSSAGFQYKIVFCEHFINIQLFPLKCVFRCGIV